MKFRDYTMVFLSFLGSLKQCKFEFDPLLSFRHLLTIFNTSLPISSDLRYEDLFDISEYLRYVSPGRLPVLLKPGGDFTGTSLRPPKAQCGLKS